MSSLDGSHQCFLTSKLSTESRTVTVSFHSDAIISNDFSKNVRIVAHNKHVYIANLPKDNQTG